MKKPQKRAATKKKTARPARKRVKKDSDAFKAVKLVIALIIVSFCISFAVITVYSNRQASLPETAGPSVTQTETAPAVTVTTTPETTVTPSAKTTPAATATTTTSAARATSTPAATATTSAATTTSSTRPTTTNASAVKPVEKTGTLVFVIDDAGNNLAELEPFLRIPGPLTIAVLPGLPHSKEAARRIRAAGKEVILHQPMEALGGQNPGPGAIYSSMGEDEIKSVLEKNLAEVGPVAGMNNHQGSKITMDGNLMEVVLAFCREKNIYFLDSRTTADTVVPDVARRLGMKIAERDTFLDNEPSREAIQRYLNSGLSRAQRNGTSIMIGHTWSGELAPLLAEQYPSLIIQGYTIKTVSDILN